MGTLREKGKGRPIDFSMRKLKLSYITKGMNRLHPSRKDLLKKKQGEREKKNNTTGEIGKGRSNGVVAPIGV